MPVTSAGKNSSAGDRLLSHITAIESLLEEKKQIAELIRERKAHAKMDGFEVAVINQIIKERAMSSADRAEWQALLDLYRAAVGMLDGTPLGDFARKKMMGDDEPASDETTADAKAEPAQPAPDVDPETGEVVDVDAARAQGREAARSGANIVSNPWKFGDPRRAAWDEGFCFETGSDGMDLPPAWRRKKPTKPGKGEGGE